MKTSRPTKVIAGAAVLLGLGVILVLLFWKAPEETQDRPDPLFREAAEESGITFRTTFLEGEQGEKFKVNLYDHGSGVAVADYDGDGYDDIYLVNQLGEN